ncbi:sugar transporter [Salipiger aestuarii]|uniref:Polysaccharide export outer membrane protein n=1 Tax=Salipiger aestuarii TaxID=568098 RepID=A0A327XTU1_9RHOB|nr:polysaccharide biosynthesis/export family protein [Salipiger aestuarii]EIE49055.1 polysaccharide biosynthesis protein [Citreicella sp. 357]KAA8606400.1 sugar transporter [Salipiger aestuarii]KAB2540718.1 sugar transporter [Salipiger aestuarii]RAK11682.1 polysaccharide export outer membrane protein [Salipiger aestuarii]
MPIVRALIVSSLLAALAVAPAAAQQGNYAIRPGDTLRLEVLEDESLNRNLLVLPDGRVSVPMAGSIPAAGRTVSQVQRNIAAALADSFALAPTVYVGINALAEIPEQVVEPMMVYVLGEAANPGLVEIRPETTVLQLFAQVGGFTNFAALKRIQLRRTDPRTGTETIYRLNYKDIQAGRSPNGLVRLVDGDVIMVPQRRLFE